MSLRYNNERKSFIGGWWNNCMRNCSTRFVYRGDNIEDGIKYIRQIENLVQTREFLIDKLFELINELKERSINVQWEHV